MHVPFSLSLSLPYWVYVYTCIASGISDMCVIRTICIYIEIASCLYAKHCNHAFTVMCVVDSFFTFSAKRFRIKNVQKFKHEFYFLKADCVKEPTRSVHVAKCRVKQFNNLPICISSAEIEMKLGETMSRIERKLKHESTAWAYACVLRLSQHHTITKLSNLYRNNDPSCSCVFYWILSILFRTKFGALIRILRETNIFMVY